MPDFALETSVSGIVCGIDEAGRGPLAGPVVAAAVIFDRGRLDRRLKRSLLDGIDDSKKLSRERRESVFAGLQEAAAADVIVFGVGEASVEEIDRINILQATYLAMERSVAALLRVPDHALVDGIGAPRLPCPARCVPKGDGLSLSIAAASVIAKVTRDHFMTALETMHPGYGFDHNFGYGTPEHMAALLRLGPTPYHRKSFAPIHKILYGDDPRLPDLA